MSIRQRRGGLAVLTLAALLISMDLSVLYVAVPHLSAQLRPGASELLWITDVYGFLLAGLLITMGTLGDRIGRRRLLTIGASLFGLASLAAAYARTPEMLIAARAVLGVAGATLGPSSLALLSNMFRDPTERARATAIWVTALSAGGAIGPLVGGALLEWFWWGSVFLLAVPVMAALVLSARRLLPEYRDESAGRLDLTSVGLSLAAVLPVVYGLKRTAEDGPDAVALLAVAAGIAVGVLFVRRQGRLADPLLDLGLFRIPAIGVSLAANLFGFFLFMGAMLFVVQHFQLVLGLSPMRAGLATVPTFTAFIAGSMLTPAVLQRYGPVPLLAGGMAVAAAGFAALSLAGGLITVIAATVVVALGLAPVFTSVATLVLGAAPPQRAGAAASMSETSTELGGALGIALLGVVGTAVYRARLDAPAGDTLGEAAAVAADLPPHAGAALLESARAAYVDGLHAVAVTSAAIALALAVTAALLLRRTAPAAEEG
jgi:MFS transporter, DHA2 family, multidrug resistance protein